MNRRGFLLSGVAASALVGEEARAWVHGAPSFPAITGDPLVGGTSFGVQNAYVPFNSVNAAASWYGMASSPAATLGATGGWSLGLTQPVNLPAYTGATGTGDHWWFFRMRTPSAGTLASTLTETILGINGQGSGAPGGQFGYASLTQIQGTFANGAQVDPVASGLMTLQRKNSGGSPWTWWNGAAVNANMQFAPATTYGVCLGLQYNAGDFGRVVIATLGGTTPVSQSGTQLTVTLRPASFPLFNLLGQIGVQTANIQGFGGELSDLWIVSGVAFPSDADVQALTNGTKTLLSVVQAAGGTAANIYHNTLDYSTVQAGSPPTIAADPAYTLSSTAVTVANNGTSNTLGMTTCGPHRGNSSLTLTRLAPYWVFPYAIGSTDGQVWFEGNCTVAGAVIRARCAYADGTFGSWGVVGNGVGAYAGSVRSAWKKPFTRQVEILGNSNSRVTEHDIMDVGAVIPMIGQSEVAHGNYSSLSGSPIGNTTSGGSAGGDGGGYFVTNPVPAATSVFASYLDNITTGSSGQSYTRISGVQPAVVLLTGGSIPADGATLIAKQVLANVGVSVMLVGVTHSGIPQDVMIFGSTTWTIPSSGIAGSATLAMLGGGTGITGAGSHASPYAFVCDPFLGNTPGTTNGNLMFQNAANSLDLISNGNVQTQIMPGTLTITMSDGSTIVDNVTSTPSGVAGNQVGTLVYGIAGANPIDSVSSVVYVDKAATSGAIKLGFQNASPPTIVSVTWTNKQDIADGSDNEKSTWINNWGARQAYNQLFSAFARFGATAIFYHWVSAIESDSGNVTTQAKNLLIKTRLIQGILQGYCYGGADAGCKTPPWVLPPKGRDGGENFNVVSHFDVSRAAQTSLWPAGQNQWPGGSNAPSSGISILPGSWGYDVALEGVGLGHPSAGTVASSTLGYQRQDERFGYDVVAALTSNTAWNLQPTWGTPVIAGNTITIPVNGLPSGASLTTDIANGGSNAALQGWWVAANSTAGAAPGTQVDNGAYATAAISGASVVITKASGNWSGTEAVRYVIGAPDTTSPSPVLPPPSFLYYSGGSTANGGSFAYSPGFAMPPLYTSSTTAP